MYKSEVGIPEPLSPRGADLRGEAAKARRRLLPTTLLYSTGSAVTLWLVGRRGLHLPLAAAFALAGVLSWTLVEYLVHRFVLHGAFPDGRGVVHRLLHRRFDHLHLEHHRRPWDGEHINGSLRDTLPFVAMLAALGAFTPLHTFPIFLVGLVQSYVVEEWIHHSVHYYNFKSRYFRYIRRHHLYHHSRNGRFVAYGLTSDLWDSACGTHALLDSRRLALGARPFETAALLPAPDAR
jgi:sterol desaturase/sphingolipid hydroxylase (fatty acid hydroxylase superfamily)